ncbi:MAG: exodeoxyribonuclease VII small subunit [Lachnospiraceae bacterium]|nr:exodeoxyribonuclease VII small subunit [Lachnospiraceae bacterium]
MADKNENNSLNLEENMRALDEVIRVLEKGDLSLEDSFEKYKEGMELLLKCNNSVDKVEKELQILESEGI